MRRTTLATATASVVLLGCLGACTNDSDAASDEAVVVQPAESATPTALDPYAWNDISYEEYLEAAEQIGLRPDVLVPEAGFSTGLSTLCRTSADEMATMRSSHVGDVADSGTYSTAQYLGDEVGLRLGLACPQRMTDWTRAGVEHEGSDAEQAEEGTAVSGDDLERATAEEDAESSSPSPHQSGDESDAGDGYHHDGDATDETDQSDDSGDDEVSATSTGGTTAANGDQRI